MSGWTNRGKYLVLGVYFRAVTATTKFYLALCADAVTPTADTNILSDLSECPNGNGYTTGGQQVNRNATDFDVYTEDDGNDKAYVQLKNFTWTAAGGNLPISGNGARWAVLLDDNATPASRQVVNYWSLGSNRTVSDTQALTIVDAEIDITES